VPSARAIVFGAERILGVTTLWAGAVLCVVLVCTTIPWNMDEFIMYHVLACWEPSQQLNVYRDSCTWYPTRLGPIEFQRSYEYVGITSSLLLAPFHALSKSIWTPYAVGALALVASVWGLVKCFMLPRCIMPALVLFLPLVFTMLHDSGPVRVGLLVMAWSPIVAVQYLEAKRSRIIWLVLLMLMWAIAVEDKPFFVYLMPGITLLSIASLSSRELLGQAGRSWKLLLILFGGAAAFDILLLAAMRANGMPYLRYLASMSPGRSIDSWISSAISGLFFIGDWPYYASRVSDYSSLGKLDAIGLIGQVADKLPLGWSTQAVVALTLTVLVVLLVIGFYAWAILRLVKYPERTTRRTALLLFLTAGVLWVGTVVAGGWAGHHFVYAQIPLLVLVAYAFAQLNEGYVRLAAAFGGLTFLSLIAIWLVPTKPKASREITVAFDKALALADSDTIINCSSWGCYYTYSLLNERNIPVVFADDAQWTQRLQDFARGQHKRIIHLCMACDLSAVKDLYTESAVTQADAHTIIWSIFCVDPSVEPCPLSAECHASAPPSQTGIPTKIVRIDNYPRPDFNYASTRKTTATIVSASD
jgi:hypothetical protein